MITKSIVKNILVWVWIILSVMYIWYDIFSKFRVNIIQKSYISWQTDVINSIINESKKWCEWFKVYSADKEVILINIECIKNINNDENK